MKVKLISVAIGGLRTIPQSLVNGQLDLEISVEVSKKLATIVEGNPKAPFSIATTPRCRGGR